jgi:hypothetical protein
VLGRFLVCFGVVAAMCLGAVGVAPADNADKESAALIHVGLNPSTCGTISGTDSGDVNVNFKVQRWFKTNIFVYGALPNTTYVVDIRCVGAIGSLTTDSEGIAKIHLPRVTPPSSPFYIDISVPNGGGGAGGYGDTFIAGPFNLD